MAATGIDDCHGAEERNVLTRNYPGKVIKSGVHITVPGTHSKTSRVHTRPCVLDFSVA